jgi:hypothetical protein
MHDPCGNRVDNYDHPQADDKDQFPGNVGELNGEKI